jgi:glutaconate CoA-transferase subunit A
LADITTLARAVAELVHDGDSVALEGFTHLIPMAAGQEIIRQRRRDLTLIRMTPDLIYDQRIGAGCASALIFSWGGNPGVGSLHRMREAMQDGWPAPLRIEEHSHAGMANRYAAGACGLPFAVMRGYTGTDLVAHTATIATVTCPFTGEVLTAVPALTPDVGIVHAQRADRRGNVQLWGITGVQKEVVLLPGRWSPWDRGHLDPVPRRWCCGWAVTAVALARRRLQCTRRVLRPRQLRVPGLGRDQPAATGSPLRDVYSSLVPTLTHRLDRGRDNHNPYRRALAGHRVFIGIRAACRQRTWPGAAQSDLSDLRVRPHRVSRRCHCHRGR